MWKLSRGNATYCSSHHLLHQCRHRHPFLFGFTCCCAVPRRKAGLTGNCASHALHDRDMSESSIHTRKDAMRTVWSPEPIISFRHTTEMPYRSMPKSIGGSIHPTCSGFTMLSHGTVYYSVSYNGIILHVHESSRFSRMYCEYACVMDKCVACHLASPGTWLDEHWRK